MLTSSCSLIKHKAVSHRTVERRTKALALCGLAVAEDASLVTAAVEAYRTARAINSDPGVIRSILQDLDALAPADPIGLLKPARAAHGASTQG
jgi:hypothetical protein